MIQLIHFISIANTESLKWIEEKLTNAENFKIWILWFQNNYISEDNSMSNDNEIRFMNDIQTEESQINEALFTNFSELNPTLAIKLKVMKLMIKPPTRTPILQKALTRHIRLIKYERIDSTTSSLSKRKAVDVDDENDTSPIGKIAKFNEYEEENCDSNLNGEEEFKDEHDVHQFQLPGMTGYPVCDDDITSCQSEEKYLSDNLIDAHNAYTAANTPDCVVTINKCDALSNYIGDLHKNKHAPLGKCFLYIFALTHICRT